MGDAIRVHVLYLLGIADAGSCTSQHLPPLPSSCPYHASGDEYNWETSISTSCVLSQVLEAHKAGILLNPTSVLRLLGVLSVRYRLSFIGPLLIHSVSLEVGHRLLEYRLPCLRWVKDRDIMTPMLRFCSILIR